MPKVFTLSLFWFILMMGRSGNRQVVNVKVLPRLRSGVIRFDEFGIKRSLKNIELS